jgi:hypothetical protein
MRLAALQSVVNTGPAGSSGCPRPPRRRGFPRIPGGSTPCVVPRSLARTGSSSRELGLLFRVRTASNLPHTRMCEAPPMGFCSQSRYQPRRSTCERDPSPALRSALGVSHTLDGLRPPRPRGLVSSHNHVRDSPFRGLFPPPSRTDSSSTRALLSLAAFSYRRVASPAPDWVTSPSGR